LQPYEQTLLGAPPLIVSTSVCTCSIYRLKIWQCSELKLRKYRPTS